MENQPEIESALLIRKMLVMQLRKLGELTVMSPGDTVAFSNLTKIYCAVMDDFRANLKAGVYRALLKGEGDKELVDPVDEPTDS